MNRTSVFKKIKIILFLFLVVISASFGYLSAKGWYGSKSIFISGRNPVSQFTSYLFAGEKLIGEKQGRINVLLLGVGGVDHEGPYLSDTIIVASIKPETKEVALLSIPRDTHITIDGSYGKYKANHAYALKAAQKGTKEGLITARKSIGNYLGIDIPYAVVVDFDGFIQAIDHLGGISVKIDHTFTDYLYPNNKNGYLSAITFKAGVEHMDGERALIYARSRQTTSDFDRARRQQRILEAFKSRAKELNLIKDVNTLNNLLNSFASNVATNLELLEAKRLSDIVLNISGDNIYSEVLDPTTGFVCSYTSKERGYHIEVCPGKTTKDIHKFAQTIFSRAHVKKENPVVEIQNATYRGGLAYSASQQLEAFGFKTSQANAAAISNSQTTKVYDLTNGQKPDSLASLMVALSAEKGNNPPVSRTSATPDFIVILGNNYRPPFLDIINLDPPEPDEPEDITNEEDESKENENSEENTEKPADESINNDNTEETKPTPYVIKEE